MTQGDGTGYLYSVSHQLMYLGWINLNLIFCQILPGLMPDVNLAKGVRQDFDLPKSKVDPTQVPVLRHPVLFPLQLAHHLSVMNVQ